MKKIVAILMVLAMLFALTACGKKEAAPAATEAPAETATEEAATEEATEEAATEEAAAEEAAEETTEG